VKKIILYCDHWQNGGVEAYLMNQLRHWDMSQIKCTLLSAEKTTDIYDKELEALGVRQEILLENLYTSAVLRISHTFSRFKRYLQENPCDVLYLNLSNSVTMRYAKLARQAGISKRIVHSHCAGIQPGLSRPVKQFAHSLAKQLYTNCATDWWACSDKAAQFLFSQNVLAHVKYIPNAIETQHFSFNTQQRMRMRTELKIKENICLIGTVGRCTPEKNQNFLLEVFAQAIKTLPNLKLLIVGDGPLRSMLEGQARRLGIWKDCIFYGFTNDTAPLYSAMDIFCLPSILEGNPVSAIEAQTSGCSCLLADTITKQAGVLPQTKFVPLQQAEWVMAIQQAHIEPNRNKNWSVMSRSMYEVKRCARMVQSLL